MTKVGTDSCTVVAGEEAEDGADGPPTDVTS